MDLRLVKTTQNVAGAREEGMLAANTQKGQITIGLAMDFTFQLSFFPYPNHTLFEQSGLPTPCVGPLTFNKQLFAYWDNQIPFLASLENLNKKM